MANLSRFVLPFADVGAGIRPSSGAKLFFFDTGTSTPKDTFSDSAGTTPNANPVIADSKGVFPDIFFIGTFKVILKDRNDVQVWEADPVSSTVDFSQSSSSFILHDTLAGAKLRDDVVAGSQVRIMERGNALFEYVTGETANTYNIIDHDTLSLQLKLIIDETINYFSFGATGLGLDDTGAIQAYYALDLPIKMPKPTVNFTVTASIVVNGGQVTTGTGKGKDNTFPGMYANMIAPIFKLGDGADAQYRKMQFKYVSVHNELGPAIMSRLATNWSCYGCNIKSSGVGFNSLDCEQTYRVAFYNCDINKSNAGYAASLLDNSNVMLFSNCQMSGGSAGGVADVGRSYNVKFDTCVFEVSRTGLRFGTNPSATVGGECNNVSVINCSFERVGEPISCGDFYAVQGFTFVDNYVSNTAMDSSWATSILRLGRLSGLVMHSNTLDPKNSEYLFTLYSEPSGTSTKFTLVDSLIEKNTFVTLGAGPFLFSGFYDTNGTGRLNEICQNTYIEYRNGQAKSAIATKIGYDSDFRGPEVTASAASIFRVIKSFGAFGGYIEEATLYRTSGGYVAGTFELGTSVSASELASIDVTTLVFVNDAVDITSLLSTRFIRINETVRFRTAGATGTIETLQLYIRMKAS